MFREAIDKIVLAAVRLVSDDDDVAPTGQQRMLRAFVLREKLLDRGEHHAARRDCQQLLQLLAALRLHGLLPQQLMAAEKRAEKLVVEVVAIRENDERRILHRRLQHEPAGIKNHCERLARALRMPDHTCAFVARHAFSQWFREVTAGRFADLTFRCCADGFGERGVDGMELMVAGDLLDERAVLRVLLENDEVMKQIEKALPVEGTPQKDLQLGHGGRGQSLALDRAPWHHAFPVGADRSDACVGAIRGDDYRVEEEE